MAERRGGEEGEKESGEWSISTMRSGQEWAAFRSRPAACRLPPAQLVLPDFHRPRFDGVSRTPLTPNTEQFSLLIESHLGCRSSLDAAT